MPKVTYKHLEDITKFLDSIKFYKATDKRNESIELKAQKLSRLIKEEYTLIKPHYEQ